MPMSSPKITRMLGLPPDAAGCRRGLRLLRLRSADRVCGRYSRSDGERSTGEQDIAATECAVFWRRLLFIRI
jgi:hypothetical protein